MKFHMVLPQLMLNIKAIKSTTTEVVDQLIPTFKWFVPLVYSKEYN